MSFVINMCLILLISAVTSDVVIQIGTETLAQSPITPKMAFNYTKVTTCVYVAVYVSL